MTPPVRGSRGAPATARTAPAVELDAMAQDQKPGGGGQRSHAPSWKVEHAPACHAGEVVVGSEIAVEAQAARLHVHVLPEQAFRGQAPEVAVDGAQAHPRKSSPGLDEDGRGRGVPGAGLHDLQNGAPRSGEAQSARPECLPGTRPFAPARGPILPGNHSQKLSGRLRPVARPVKAAPARTAAARRWRWRGPSGTMRRLEGQAMRVAPGLRIE